MKFKKGKLEIGKRGEGNFKNFILVFVIIFLLGIVSADILSINSGGNDQMIINPGTGIEDFFFNFNLRPLMSNVILSSTFGTNFTMENLSVTYTSSDPDDDVITNISDWRLDGNSIAVLNLPFDSYKVQGNIRDYSSYENNGTLGGGDNSKAPVWQSNCQVGGCYQFDGSDDWINIPNDASFDFGIGDFSLETWFRVEELPNSYTGLIVRGASGGVGYSMTISSLNRLSADIQGTTGSNQHVNCVASTISSDTWHHGIAVFDRDDIIRLYLDGNEVCIADYFAGNDDSVSTSIPLYLGSYFSSSWFLNGSLDETKVYSWALSPEQIKLNYNSGLAGHSIETLVSQETNKGDVWQVAMTSNDGFYDSETVLSNELTIVNDVPIDPEPVLVSVDGTNESDADLNCSSFVYDGDSDTLNVTVRWYLEDILNFSVDYDNDYSNASLFYSILDSGNLTLGDVWMCEVRLDDGEDTSDWIESNNLTIIDITDPLVYIISPESTNYSTLNVSFNVSIVENENVSMCFYDLDDEGNISMNELNDSYFWYGPSLGPGDHEVWFYCNDTSGNWGSNYTNFSIDNEAAIAILLSDELQQQVRWDVVSLPIDDLDAEGNNLNNSTDYFVNVSATNTLVDLYVRADGDLFNAGLDVIGLGNETFSFSENNSYVNDSSKVVMNTTYVLIGNALGDNSTVFLKFYLDAPVSQAAGEYLNQLDFKAVRAGESP